MARTHQTLLDRQIGLFDVWFLDDGQLVCQPKDADSVLRTFDEHAATVGARRATGSAAKSVARLCGCPEAVEQHAQGDWCTEYIQTSTSKQQSWDRHVLGIDFGSEDSATAQFRKAAANVSELHDALSTVDDTASELVLLRKCADVCKVTHLLRAAGASIDGAVLEEYDDVLHQSLSRSLGGQLDDLSDLQATLGIGQSGLGMRGASQVALPAFIASRVESKWIVVQLGAQIGQLGVDTVTLFALYDEETAAACQSFEQSLPPGAADQCKALVQTALGPAAGGPSLDPQQRRRLGALTGDGLVLPAGYEDREFEPMGLQASLLALQDDREVVHLLTQLNARGLHDRARRVTDLKDTGVCHDWLWRISPAHGPTVPAAEYAPAVRLRLGAPVVPPDTICAKCGAAMGSSASHALCCNLAEATRGHYAVRDEVLTLAHLADSMSAVEVPGLIPSRPSLRPADILTSAAVPGRLAALDIGISSPDSTGAGLDCCAAMEKRKHREYARYTDELKENGGIVYKPLVWSAWGRPHIETQVMLESMAKIVARRKGLQDYRLVLRRVQCAISVQLARRAVRMLFGCIPRLEAEEMQTLLGEADTKSQLCSSLHSPGNRAVVLVDGDAHVSSRPAGGDCASESRLA